jgi:hypothetical protein
VTEDNVWKILPAQREECRKVIAQKVTQVINYQWNIADVKLIQGSSSMKTVVLTDHQGIANLIYDDDNEVNGNLRLIGENVVMADYKRKGGFLDDVPYQVNKEYCDILKNLWTLRHELSDLLTPMMAASAVKGDEFMWKVLYPGGVPMQCCEMLKQIRRGTSVCLWRENEKVLNAIMNMLK